MSQYIHCTEHCKDWGICVAWHVSAGNCPNCKRDTKLELDTKVKAYPTVEEALAAIHKR